MIGKLDFGRANGLKTLLSYQFWDLYVICNEHGKTIYDVWNGQDLKLTFRRSVGERMFLKWSEVKDITSSIIFSTKPDRVIWRYSSNGLYSSQF